MERNPIRNDARKARRRRKLGPGGPCMLCGRETLKAFRVINYSVIEEDHIVGKAIDPELTVFLCRGCHDAQGELRRVHGVELRHEPRPWPELLIDILKGIGLFLISLGEKLVEWAERQAAFISALDANYPQWRSLPEV